MIADYDGLDADIDIMQDMLESFEHNGIMIDTDLVRKGNYPSFSFLEDHGLIKLWKATQNRDSGWEDRTYQYTITLKGKGIIKKTVRKFVDELRAVDGIKNDEIIRQAALVKASTDAAEAAKKSLNANWIIGACTVLILTIQTCNSIGTQKIELSDKQSMQLPLEQIGQEIRNINANQSKSLIEQATFRTELHKLSTKLDSTYKSNLHPKK